MDVRFACPVCEQAARVELPGPVDWQCPACDQRQRIEGRDPALPSCPLCGNHELYKKKDFPHWLGLTILTVACLGFLAGQAYYLPWLAWAILLGFAAADALLYLLVGDAVVCYRCQAHYHGFTPTPAHQPFELSIAERYRQERLRRDQMKAEAERREP